jgi:hypothetical protein
MDLANLYARSFAAGHTDTIRLESEDGVRSADPVLAKVTSHGSGDLVGAVEASSYSILALAADLVAYGEPRDGDRVYMRGRRYTIQACDPHRRAHGGKPLAFTIDVRG